MALTALVTGSVERVADVGDALEKAGFGVTRADTDDKIATACAQIATSSLDVYVQLPRGTDVSGPTLVDRVRRFLAGGLLARFETTSRVMPLLGADACVVLVAGNVPGAPTPDDRHARIDLLRVLARAILAEERQGDLRAVVVGYDRSAAEIAEIALNRGDESRLRSARVAALDPELPYADWQREYLTLTTEE